VIEPPGGEGKAPHTLESKQSFFFRPRSPHGFPPEKKQPLPPPPPPRFTQIGAWCFFFGGSGSQKRKNTQTWARAPLPPRPPPRFFFIWRLFWFLFFARPPPPPAPPPPPPPPPFLITLFVPRRSKIKTPAPESPLAFSSFFFSLFFPGGPHVQGPHIRVRFWGGKGVFLGAPRRSPLFGGQILGFSPTPPPRVTDRGPQKKK